MKEPGKSDILQTYFLMVEFSEYCPNFYKQIVSIHDNLHKTITMNKDWFDYEIDEYTVIDSFQNPICHSLDLDSLPMFLLKIPINNGCIDCVFTDDLGNKTTIKNIHKDTSVVLTLHMNGIKFYKDKIVPDWKLIHCKISDTKLVDFREDSDEDENLIN